MKKIFIVFLMGCLSSICYATEVTLHTLQENISFSSLKGKWIFINYWASWCPPCLDEIPALNAFHRSHSAKDIAVFAMNYEGYSVAEQKQLAKIFNIQYPSLIEDPAHALALGHVKTLPATFVFDPNGNRYDVIYGGQTLPSLNRYLKTIKQNFVQEQPLKSHVYKPSV